MRPPVKTHDEPVGRAASVIAGKIRRRIIRGELAEGDSLPSETQLLDEFGVSRPTLREAIRVLESESLVMVKRGSRGGIVVSVPRVQTAAHYAGLLLEYQQTTITDVFTAAATVETACVTMLARTRTAADLKQLRAAVAAEGAAHEDRRRRLESQNDFHHLLIDLAGNDTLRVFSEVLRHIIEVATQRYVTDPGIAEVDRAPASTAASRTHEKLVQFIADKDVAAAEALWRKHILATSAQLRAAGIADSVVDLLEPPPM